MKIVSVSKEVKYTITDEKDNEHQFVVGETSKDKNGNPVIYISGDHEHEEIEIPLVEIPFLIKVLTMFMEDTQFRPCNVLFNRFSNNPSNTKNTYICHEEKR